MATVLTEAFSTPERDAGFNYAFDHQLGIRIRYGFHTALGKSVGEYIESYQHLLLGGKFDSNAHLGRPAFVEPRIPIEEQLDLLGVFRDPSVFALPDDSQSTSPYVTRIRRVSVNNLPPEKVHEEIEQAGRRQRLSVRLASLLEGLALFDIDTPQYVSGPHNSRVLCLDTYAGRPRLSKPETGSWDSGIRSALVTISERRKYG
jgi:hypothetical protein